MNLLFCTKKSEEKVLSIENISANKFNLLHRTLFKEVHHTKTLNSMMMKQQKLLYSSEEKVSTFTPKKIVNSYSKDQRLYRQTLQVSVLSNDNVVRRY